MENQWKLSAVEKIMCLDHGIDFDVLEAGAMNGDTECQHTIEAMRKWLDTNMPGMNERSDEFKGLLEIV